MSPRHLILSACVAVLAAADNTPPPPAVEPGPHAAAPVAPPPGMRAMPRMTQLFEVETITVKTGNAASLAAWVELAAQGYHIAAAVPADGGTTLYLERNGSPMNPGPIQIPAAIEQDKAVADALHAKLQALQAERQKMMGPRPMPGALPPGPAPAPSLVQPAVPAPSPAPAK